MSNNQTKILIGLILGLIFILSGYGAYKYFTGGAGENGGVGGDASTFPESGSIVPGGDSTVDVSDGQPSGSTGGVGSSVTQGVVVDELDIKVVSERPTTGGVFIEKEDPESPIKAKKLYVRYIERESGHIYEMAYNENIPSKVSNTTITRVYETYSNNTNRVVLIRRLSEADEIQNLYAVLEEKAPTTSPAALIEAVAGKLNQSLLSFNIKGVAISPNKNKIFYLTEVGDNFVGTIEDFTVRSGVGKKQVFTSPLHEWLIQWPEENTLFFNTKPSANIPGFLFSQSLNKTGIVKVLDSINGLTSNVSPDTKTILYSESTPSGLKTYLYNTTTKESSALSLATLPEKCTWGGADKTTLYCAVPSSLPLAEYPDFWYQGIISFGDEMWKIDSITGNTELLVDKATLERGGGVDAINLVLNSNENYILFTNKKDSSLWQIKIK